VVRKAVYAGRAVAVKVTSLSKMTAAPLVEILAEAQNEAKIMVQLVHPNITQFCGVAMYYTDIEVHVLTVLEFCEHGSVDDYIVNNSAHARAKAKKPKMPPKTKSGYLDRLIAAAKKSSSKKFSLNKMVHAKVWEDVSMADKIELCRGVAKGMTCEYTGDLLASCTID
jgi:serine/threonine protein kinase